MVSAPRCEYPALRTIAVLDILPMCHAPRTSLPENPRNLPSARRGSAGRSSSGPHDRQDLRRLQRPSWRTATLRDRCLKGYDLQNDFIGHSWQDGFLAVQQVAPKSMIAWLKS